MASLPWVQSLVCVLGSRTGGTLGVGVGQEGLLKLPARNAIRRNFSGT